MSKDNNSLIDLSGVITKIIPGGKFEVTIENEKGNKFIAVCHPSGKLRVNNIRLVLGDKVDVSVSPYDVKHGVITWRY